MCGIAGTYGLADHDVIAHMVSAQAHRGPDDEGVYLDEANRVALGHRRLSIIDLSPAGHQPMSYGHGRYWITHNGEVYNFAEIRTELEGKGHVFRSSTDTEVILAAYAEWRTACLERFRGMFAFAICDQERRQLFLARDRFGIKPLYWAQVNGGFLFASELKGMLASGLISRQLDRQAIWDYLSLASVPPPRTILANVSALLPGHYMVVQDGQIKIEQYWDLRKPSDSDNPTTRMEPEEIAAELRRLLEESTRLHMIADVPVGAFLSGGVDSTAVVGLMSEHVSSPLKTYSIGFEGRGARISELPWAKIAAERFGTDHTEVIVTGEDVTREFDRLIEAIDQPSGDGVNSYFVSKAARTGVTVALSGLGGDEFFAGYPQFRRFAQAERLLPHGDGLAGRALRSLGRLLPGRWRLQAEFIGGLPLERHASVRRLYGEQEKHLLLADSLQDGFAPRPVTDFYARHLSPELDVVARTSYAEAKGYMAHTLLRDSDVMSMAHALEVRVPLLDHKLAEFAFRLPPEFKLNSQGTKIILLEALRDLIPEPIAQRQKMGFEFPMRDWLAGPLASLAHEILGSAEATQVFDGAGLSKLQAQVSDCRGSHVRVWAPIVLVAWMQRHRCYL